MNELIYSLIPVNAASTVNALRVMLSHVCVLCCAVLAVLFRFREATNMTDRMAALTVLCDHDTPGRAAALQVRLLSWHVDDSTTTTTHFVFRCCDQTMPSAVDALAAVALI